VIIVRDLAVDLAGLKGVNLDVEPGQIVAIGGARCLWQAHAQRPAGTPLTCGKTALQPGRGVQKPGAPARAVHIGASVGGGWTIAGRAVDHRRHGRSTTPLFRS